MTKINEANSPSTSRRTPTRGARRRAREFALQAVYAWLVGGDDNAGVGAIDAHIRDDAEFSQADASWYKTLLYGIADQKDSLQEHFVPFIDRTLAELSPIEHGILLIGTYELVNHIEVPYRAAINEAVELAKSFGGTDGFKFVNGVLDRVAAEVRPLEVKSVQRR